jgi:glycosyltransferase involved in cell wall biosynthesis
MINNRRRYALDITAIPQKTTGIGNYTLQLVSALKRNVNTDREELIVFGRSDQCSLDACKGVTFVDCGNLSTAKRIVWEQFVLPRKLKALHIDLLHSPNYTIPLFTKCITVCTIHDLTCFIFPHRRTFWHGMYFRIMMKLTARFADQIIAVSHNTAVDIQKILPNTKRPVSVIYQGVKALFVNTASKNQDVETTYNLLLPYFLFVSTLEPSKNISNIIKAFWQLWEMDKKCSLVFVGKTGWGVSEEMEIIKSHLNDRKLVYLSYISDLELIDLYKGAKGFIYTSLYEGFGIPPLEAMACGVPVICSNTSSIPEVVGKAALTVDPQQPTQIANAVTTILENSPRRNQLIEAGYHQYKKFNWDSSATETLALYSQLLVD